MAYVSQEDKANLAPVIRAVLARYKMKGTIAVRHHSTLVVTVKSGAIDFGGTNIDVNEYWIHEHYTGRARRFLTELLAAMKGPNYFNHDDAQTDYFHRSHYTDIRIGNWKTPYVFMGRSKDGTVNGVAEEAYTFA
jgi:hypothetical protein